MDDAARPVVGSQPGSRIARSGTAVRAARVRAAAAYGPSAGETSGWLPAGQWPSSASHFSVTPSFHVRCDAPDGPQRVLDHVRASKRSAQLLGRAEAHDGQHLVQALQNAARHPRRLMFQPPGQVAQQALG